jgi:hypothetical protein
MEEKGEERGECGDLIGRVGEAIEARERAGEVGRWGSCAREKRDRG